MADVVQTDALSANSQTRSAPPVIDYKPYIKDNQGRLAVNIINSHFGTGEKRMNITSDVGNSLVDAIGTAFPKSRFGEDETREHFALLAAKDGIAYPGHEVVGVGGGIYNLKSQHDQWSKALLTAKSQFMREGRFDSAGFKVYLATRLVSLAGRGELTRDGKMVFNNTDMAIQGFENFLYLARELGMIQEDYLAGGNFSLTADVERIIKSWQYNYQNGKENMSSAQLDEFRNIKEASKKSSTLAIKLQDEISEFSQTGRVPFGLESREEIDKFLSIKGIRKFNQDEVIL